MTGDDASEDEDEEWDGEQDVDDEDEDSREDEMVGRLGEGPVSTRGAGGGGEDLFLFTGEPTGTRLAGPEIFFVSFFSGVLTGDVMGGSAEPARKDVGDLRAREDVGDGEGVSGTGCSRAGMKANNGARSGQTVKGFITSYPVFSVGPCRPH